MNERRIINDLFELSEMDTDLKGFADAVLKLIEKYFGFEKLLLGVTRSDCEEVSIISTRGLGEEFVLAASGRVAAGVRRKVTLSGKPMVIEDISDSQFTLPAVSIFRKEGISSYLCVPISGDYEPLGIIDIYSVDPDVFNKDVVENLMEMVSVISHFFFFIKDREDIRTRLRRLEKTNAELNKISSFYQSIMESLPIGVIATDMKGYVVLMNKVLEGMSLFDRTNCLGKRWYEVFGFEGEIRKKLLSTFRTSKRQLFPTIDLPLRDGSVLPVEMTTDIVRDLSGNVVGVVAICSDIEEKRRIEQEIEKIERIAAIGKLATGIAHEIRNPLAGISGVVQVLKSRVRGRSDLEAIIDRVLREIQRLDNVVDHLNCVAFQKKIRLGSYKITDIIEDGLFFLRKPLQQHKISLKRRFKTDSLVMVDRDGIYQVILNIVINAMNVMPRGGELSVEAEIIDDVEVLGDNIVWHKEINLSSIQLSKKRGRYVSIMISDNGPGIPRAICPKIFDPFFTTSESGTGLGLYIAAKIVEQQHGLIGVRSEKGRGAAFYVLIPLRERGED